MENFQTPQSNNIKKQKTRLLVILGILLTIFVVLVFLVTSTTRQEKRAQRQAEQDLLNIENAREMIDSGLAPVGLVNIELMESFPVQARVVVTGSMADNCTTPTVRGIDFDEEKGQFDIELGSEYPIDAACLTETTPYSQFIPLDLTGLVAGTYTVDVNGTTATFTLDIDNEISYELDKG